MTLLTTGCQLDGTRQFAWNPFSKKPKAETVAGAESASFSLPKFARRKPDDATSPESSTQTPVAEEQVERLLEQGQLALQDNRLDDARKAYGDVLNTSPDNATAHHGMAMAADLSNQWADAEYHYRQALRIRPRDANLLCDIGYSYLLQNRYSEAARYLNHAIETNPDHESAHMNLALLDLKQGNRAAAEQRIATRFGSNGNATQVLAQLENQIGAVSASFQEEPRNVIPANATFEQIQEIARQERIEAERRRALAGIPDAPLNSAASGNQQVSVLSNQPAAPQGSAMDSRSSMPMSSDALNHQAHSAVAVSSAMPNSSPPGSPVSRSQDPQPWASSPASGMGHPLTASVQPRDFIPPQTGLNYGTAPATQPNSAPPQMMASQSPPGSSPAAYGSAPSVNSTSMAPTHLNSAAAVPGFNPTVSAGFQPPYSPSNAAISDTPGQIVQVRSSGAFQSAAAGSVSYGQPVGFSPAPVNNGSFNGLPSATQQGTFVTQNYPTGSQPQEMRSNMPAGTNNPPVYVDGLNAGPGAIFPISQPSNSQSQPGMNPAGGDGNGGLRMGNVSSPGSNSLINGTMYAQPQSTLPSQEWMNQQQIQMQAQQLTKPYQPNAQQSATAPFPAPAPSAWTSRPPAANPLEAYELQRQKLDNEYNARLQQMDRSNPANAPRFQ
jgi:Flp pilus assembly protein TadD